jgi:serine/threonine protein phosphatase PrpC
MHEADWSSIGTTDIGTVRKVNEDNYLDAPEAGMWCVADGMGGHDKGDVASQMIVDYLEVLAKPEFYPLRVVQIKERLDAVNDRLIAIANEMPESSVIGSTVVILIFDEHDAHCIWAGDSRIYRMRDNQFIRLTRDHSQVEEMVEAGLLSADEAEKHPAANVITRAVGAAVTLDLEVASYPLKEGDKFLLCSDGLNKVMSDDEIANVLRMSSLDDVPDSLIKTSLERMARDNVTVVAVSNQTVPENEFFGQDMLECTLPLVPVDMDATLPLKR